MEDLAGGLAEAADLGDKKEISMVNEITLSASFSSADGALLLETIGRRCPTTM